MTDEERREFLELLKDAHSVLGELDEWLGRASAEMNRAGIAALQVEAAEVRKLARTFAGRINTQISTQKAIAAGRVSTSPSGRGRP